MVTGARGLIGREAVRALVDRGVEVHAVGRTPSVNKGVVWHAADLLADDGMRLVTEVRPEILLHLAWVTTPGEFWSSGENLGWVAASLRLLQAFGLSGGRRFVGAGSCAEYDWDSARASLGEGHRVSPSTLYGEAKASLHALARRWASQEGISAAWGRVFQVYGPGEDRRRLLASLAHGLAQGVPVPLTQGRQVRDFVHARDVGCAFAALALSSVDGAVNIATGVGTSVRDAAELVGQAAGRPDLLRLGARVERIGEPDVLVAQIDRLRHEVGYEPRVTLEAGVHEIWQHIAMREVAGRGGGGSLPC